MIIEVRRRREVENDDDFTELNNILQTWRMSEYKVRVLDDGKILFNEDKEANNNQPRPAPINSMRGDNPSIELNSRAIFNEE